MTSSSPVTLIVDDDASFCAALRDAFRRRGHLALVAHNCEEALAEARAWNPSRAVVDLRMPRSSGLTTIEALLDEFPDLAVVVLTGYSSIETAVAAIRLGAKNYLTKPTNVADILAAFETEPSTNIEIKAKNRSLREVEEAHINAVLEQTGGNVSESARQLGINRRTLQRRLAREEDE